MPALLFAFLAAVPTPGVDCGRVLDGMKLHVARRPFHLDDLPSGDWIPLPDAVAQAVCRVGPDGRLGDCRSALHDERGPWLERELAARWKVVDRRSGGCAIAGRQARFTVHFTWHDGAATGANMGAVPAVSHHVRKRTRRPRPPVPAPAPDIYSEAFQRQLARDQAAALRRASRTRTNVHRTFAVGWEMHHGFYLSRSDKPDEIVIPDFADERALADFQAQNTQEVLRAHVGERLSCACDGVAWTFYTQSRFIVRAARLEWIR
jgi:hypothetical protein